MIIVERQKQKKQKKCVIKRILKFNDYGECLLNDKIILKSQQRFKMIIIMYTLNESIRLR